ncbi:MAG: helix-turn-helix transcriptional regulator [Pontixanthobacter sp.]
MINRIRDIRQAKAMTLAELAAACDPPTTAQTIGRLETGMRNLSIKWMDRIADALDVDPQSLVRSDDTAQPRIVARLLADGPEAMTREIDAVLPTEIGGATPLMAMAIDIGAGEYRAGDQLWLRQIDPADAAQSINRDVLVPRKGGRFSFGRLIDRQGAKVGILPPGAGQKQQVVDDPPWIAVAQMLVRPL